MGPKTLPKERGSVYPGDMRNVIAALALAALLAPPASAQRSLRITGFSAEILDPVPDPGSGLRELADKLRLSRERRETLELLKQVEAWSRRPEPSEEDDLVRALVHRADFPGLESDIRFRAVHVLGKVGAWVRSPIAQTEAVESLLSIARSRQSTDARFALRADAFRALAVWSKSLPHHATRTREQIISETYTFLESSVDPQERTSAIKVLHGLVEGQGAWVLMDGVSVRAQTEYFFIERLENRLPQLYSSPSSNVEERYLLISVLRRLAWAHQAEGGRIQHRAKQILKDMSYQETEPHLKRLACLYSGQSACRNPTS